MSLNFLVLNDLYAIYKLSTDSEIPEWINKSDFYSITRTKEELSIVCKQTNPDKDILDINKDWRVLKILGPLDFSLIGIIADVSKIMKENSISIFAISTFDTDYILVKNHNLSKAIDSLATNGHKISYHV